jgi:hypothetical protein
MSINKTALKLITFGGIFSTRLSSFKWARRKLQMKDIERIYRRDRAKK